MLTLQPFLVIDHTRLTPTECRTVPGEQGAAIFCSYANGFSDKLYFTVLDDGALICRRSIENRGADCQVEEIGLQLDGIRLGGTPERDYFYHTENPRIYSRLTFPVDYNRTVQDAAATDFDPVAGNRWADPGVVCERIGNSPYQPFPALLLGNFDSPRGLVHGTLSQKIFYHSYLVSHHENALRLEIFSGFKAIRALAWAAGRIAVDEWYLGGTGEADHFERIFAGYTTELRKKLPPMYGAANINRDNLVWGSWNDGILRNISEDMILREAEFLKANFPTVRWIQVDDGYAVHTPPAHGLGMPYEGEAGVDAGKFPQGLRHLTDKIREIGLRPAIWIGGFCPKKTPIYQEHPEWFVDYSYRVDVSAPLDVSLPEVRDYIQKAFDTLLLDYGFEGVKHDFWSYVFEDSHDLLHNQSASGYQWREWWLKEIRRRIPADAYMQTGCDIVMGNPFLGEFFTNYRYGIDIGSGDWDYVKTNFLWGIACFATHTSDLFVPNSDSIGLFRDLDDTDAMFALNYCLATRSAVEIAGRLSSCDQQSARFRALRKAACNPNNGQEIFFACFDYRSRPAPVPNIIYFKTGHFTPIENAPGLPLRSVGLFNIDDAPVNVRMAPEDLGLEQGSYLLTDVWSGEVAGFDGELFFDLPRHGSRLLNVSRAENLQLLDADLRVTAATGDSFTFGFEADTELTFNRQIRAVICEGRALRFQAERKHMSWVVHCHVPAGRPVRFC